MQAMHQLLEDTGADGYNGDTMVLRAAAPAAAAAVTVALQVFFDHSYWAATHAVLEPGFGFLF